MRAVTGERARPAETDPCLDGTGRLRDAWAHTELRWLLAHHAVAGVGQTFGTVAIGVALYEQTGSESWVAAAAAARLLPYLLLAGVAGAIADRVDRRRLLLWSSIGRGIALVALTAAIVMEVHPASAVALVLVVTALGTGSFPALMAMLPSTVPAHHLVPASTLLNTVETVAWLVGPALGGLVILHGVPPHALLVNVAVFALAGALVAPTSSRPAAGRSGADSSIRLDLRIGLAAAARPAVREALVLVVVVNVAVGAGPVAMLLASQRFADASNAYALLVLAAGAGGVAGIGATRRIVASGSRRGLTGAAIAAVLPFLALGWGHASLGMLIGAMAVAGAGAVATEVATLTLLLRSLPEEVAGRVFGLVDSLLVASVLAGAVLAPVLAGAGGLRLLIAAVALGLSLAAVFGPRLAGRGPTPAKMAGGAASPAATPAPM